MASFSSVLFGSFLALMAGALLALGMNVQRYALIHDPGDPVTLISCNSRIVCKCSRNWAWIAGLALYGAANGLYSPSLSMAPLSLMGSIFTLLLVFNMLFSRILLKDVLTPPKVASCLIIVVGVMCVAGGTPTDSKSDFSPPEVVDLFKSPSGALWCMFLLAVLGSTVALIVWYEKTYPLDFVAQQESESDHLEITSPSRDGPPKYIPEKVTDSPSDGDSEISTVGVLDMDTDTPTTRSRSRSVLTHIGDLPPPMWLDSLMAVVYPASLGTDEAICQICLKAAISMLSNCDGDECSMWPIFVCWSVWVVASLATTVYMRIVFQRYETTKALPVEYGTVNVLNVASGLFFYHEGSTMANWQLFMLLLGSFIIMLGIGVSTLQHLPFFEVSEDEPESPIELDAGQVEVECYPGVIDGMMPTPVASKTPTGDKELT